MSFTQTTNYGLYKPTINSDNDQWGNHLNSNADTLDATIKTVENKAGVTTFNTRPGAVTLSNADVVAVLPGSSTLPSMDSAATVGTGTTWARADHVHPVDTSRYAAANPSGYQTAAQVATAVATAQTNVGRNLIHNPLFNVAQRGVGPFTTSVYSLDRWGLVVSLDAASFTQQGLADSYRTQIGDEEANFALANTFTGNAGAAAYDFAYQRIENVRRLAGKTITLGFWALCGSGALKLGISMQQGFGSGGSPSAGVVLTSQSVTLGTTFTRYNLTFVVPSISGKTLGTNNDHFTQLSFYYSSGATNNAIAGGIGVQSGTIWLWGVQLEVGSAATPLEKPDPQQDLARCQRMFCLVPIHALIQATAAGQYVCMSGYPPVAMRAAPTQTSQTINADTNVGVVSVDNLFPGGFRMFATSSAAGAAAFDRLVALAADL